MQGFSIQNLVILKILIPILKKQPINNQESNQDFIKKISTNQLPALVAWLLLIHSNIIIKIIPIIIHQNKIFQNNLQVRTIL